jgi:hypothetical protein
MAPGYSTLGITSGLPVIHQQSTGKASSSVSAGQEQPVEFRQASSRYGQAAWRENACCGIALIHDPRMPVSLIGSYPQE